MLFPEDSTYAGLDYGRAELSAVMRRTYDEIIDFITTPAFRALIEEMGELAASQRPAFIADVLMDPDALAARGIVAPEGILIQRSAFGDRRPTLFAVKKFLPAAYSNVWQNVNITFDNEFLDQSVSREPEQCWRAPLIPATQAAAMAEGLDLESL